MGTDRRTHWREMVRNPALMVWALFLLMNPLYVFKAGLPQPGDWLVVILFPVTLFTWNGVLDAQSSRTVRVLLWFTLWVFVVNYAWALVLGTWKSPKDFILHPVFYFFNAAVFLCALIQARRDRLAFLSITVGSVFVTILVLVASSFVYRTQDPRARVFFANPNQLGYYAVLCACLFAIAQRPLGISRLKAAVGITSCAYLALLSASRSSLAGVLMLLVLLVFSSPRIIIGAMIAAVALVSVGGPVSRAIEVSQQRATEDRDPSMSFAEERGYDRILKNPEYLITGAGEGGYERFVTRKGEKRRELHSSFGTVAFGYGIIGLTLLAVFVARVLKGAPVRMSLMLLPASLYTAAHQGIRFTMLWVLLAAFVVLKQMPELRTEPS